MAAVLMLVFQNTILSLVASVQISSYDMIRIGDWIEMPSLGADGTVIDIALHTVTVQNFDKTYTVIPTNKLVTDTFKNWRGMTDLGRRRIKRAFYVDQSSVHFLSDDDIARLKHFLLLETYIDKKSHELAEWNSSVKELFNQRRMTNLGTFRAYMLLYLQKHEGIAQDQTLLVRQLQPTAQGLPLELYCFTNTINWNIYEDIQSDIFDHLFAIIGEFGLRAYQAPSGADFQNIQLERQELNTPEDLPKD